MANYIAAAVSEAGDVLGVSVSKPVNQVVVSIGWVNEYDPDAETINVSPEDLPRLIQMLETALETMQERGHVT